MKKTRNKPMDSDDDMDDLPLRYVSSSRKKYSNKEELKTFSINACEFCEKTFNNRYDHLIHNSKHIIIPLIKLLPNYCGECRQYFLSDEEINNHKAEKHKTKSHDVVKTNNSQSTKIETANRIEDLQDDDKPLSRIFKKEIEKSSDIKNNMKKDHVLENLVMNCKVDIEKMEASWLFQSNAVKINHKNVNDIKPLAMKSQTVNEAINSKETVKAESIKSGTHKAKAIDKDESIEYNNCVEKLKRLAQDFNGINREGEFENYVSTLDVDDGIIETHIVDIESSVNYKNEIEDFIDDLEIIEDYDIFSDSSRFGIIEEEEYDDPIIILTPDKKESMHHPSIPYNELVKPGIYQCKRCFKRYPTKYELIIHETTHLNMSKAYLERSKEKHKNQEAASTSSSVMTKHVEPVLVYKDDAINKRVIEKNISEFHCDGCTMRFADKRMFNAHSNVCNGEATVPLCDMCLYFQDKPINVQFYSISVMEKPEMKRSCHWCKEITSEMSLVTIKTKPRKKVKKLADRIQFEISPRKNKNGFYEVKTLNRRLIGSSGRIKRAYKRKNSKGNVTKPLTNRERLKLIQSRLKIMKK